MGSSLSLKKRLTKLSKVGMEVVKAPRNRLPKTNKP